MASLPTPRKDAWTDTEDGREHEEQFKPLTPEEASALRQKEPPLSPWRVLQVQMAVGAGLAVLAWLISHRSELAWSVLYGAACVVVPGALMARGMTSRLSSVSPGASALSFMLWEMVKIAVSIAMLALAPRLVAALSWPALLVGLVLCMKVYWWALLWRPKPRVAKTGRQG
jgi:ATP synthase protein I